MSALRIQEQSLFYEVHGKGEPLLLLHGWLQVGRELLSLTKELAKHYHVIVPDLPGYGRSVPPFREFPADFYQRDAEKIGQLIDALKLRKVHIAGYSDGGEVALLLGITRPELCRSVIAWGATGHFAPHLCDDVQRLIGSYVPQPEEQALHPKQDISRWPQQWVEAFCSIVAAGGDVSLSQAHKLNAPLLLMVGDQDALNPPEAARRFVDTVRQSHPSDNIQRVFRLFVQTGHAIHEQRPVQFLETVLDFLRNCN